MTGTLRYFAYGSNMLTRRLRAEDRAPSARALGAGFVRGRRLRFDKVSRDGSGKCDAERTDVATDRVHGVVFEIRSEEERSLDEAEGLGHGYEKRRVDVETPGGVVTAIAYIATHKDPALRPWHWYKALAIAGAIEHGLPADYVRWLGTFESVDDPDARRRATHEALLAARSSRRG